MELTKDPEQIVETDQTKLTSAASIKVVCLVPSWTETLLVCGINVVGRTRFCIHPSEVVEDIPVVGGTKDIDWEKVKALEPDLVIMDKEENPKEFADQCPLSYLATHVDSIESVAASLMLMSDKLNNQKLFNLAGRWQSIAAHPELAVKDLNKFPGLVQWIKKPEARIKRIYYLIWKNPWMTISKKTFIFSVLEKLGVGKYLVEFEEKYPEINLEDLDADSTLLMFSTEPYPFLKKIDELADLPFPSIILNGECYSWFGVRSLIFLETQMELFKPRKNIFHIKNK